MAPNQNDDGSHHVHRRKQSLAPKPNTNGPQNREYSFDDIAGDSPQGVNARKIIRKRLRDYDSVNPPSTLGDFGAEGNKEWIQYFLPDDERVPSDSAVCPFSHRTTKEP